MTKHAANLFILTFSFGRYIYVDDTKRPLPPAALSTRWAASLADEGNAIRGRLRGVVMPPLMETTYTVQCWQMTLACRAIRRHLPFLFIQIFV
jgi:hypothetical protein